MIRICLDKTLKKCNVSRYELAKRTGIQYQIIDNYYKNRVKRYDSYVLERICIALECGINDVIIPIVMLKCNICFSYHCISNNPRTW